MINKKQTHYLTAFRIKVKAILLFCAIFQFSSLVYGSEPQIITLSIGEQKEIKLKGVTKISLGNRDIIKLKKLKNSVMIKAQKMGYSDLYLWNRDKHLFHIYVSSKRNQLKEIHFKNEIEKIGLNWKLYGRHFTVKGELKSLNSYLIFQKIKQHSKDTLYQVQVSSPVLKDLKSKLINSFSINQPVSCNLNQGTLQCFFNTFAQEKRKIRSFEKEWGLEIIHSLKLFQNYKVDLFLLHSKALSREQQQLGLSQFPSWKPKDAHIMRSNQKGALLAHSTLYIKEDQEGEISLGEDTAYSSYQDGRRETYWRFSGLKIKIKLETREHFAHIHNKVHFTLPSDKSAEILRNNSRLDVSFEKVTPLFKMNLKTLDIGQENIPFIRHIPFLRQILKGAHNFKAEGHLLGYIYLSKVNNVPVPKD